jgi:hypothetical protein
MPEPRASLGFASALVLAVSTASSAAFSATPELDVQLACEGPRAPGRVRCDVELRAREGARLAWSDVLVVSAPRAARPLRSRVAAASGADGVGRAALALVASATGVFPLAVRGRAVVCGGEATEARCVPVVREVEVQVRVGAD